MSTPTQEQIDAYDYALSVFRDKNLSGNYYVSIPGEVEIERVHLPKDGSRLASLIATHEGVELSHSRSGFVPWQDTLPGFTAEEEAEIERQSGLAERSTAPVVYGSDYDEDEEEKQEALKRLRISAWAHDQIAKEHADENYAGSISDDDDDDEEPAEPLVDLLIGYQHKVIFGGVGGTGKSTRLVQLAGDLVDGRPWMDYFATHLPDFEHVGYVNLEMTRADMSDKLRRMGIENSDRIHVVTRMEGSVAFTGRSRDDMLGWIYDNDISVLIVDSLRGIFDGDRIEDNTQLEHFYRRARSFMTEAALRSLVIAAHSPKATPDDVLGGVTSINWADDVVMLTGIQDQPRKLKLRTQRIRPWLQGQITLEYDPDTERSTVKTNESLIIKDKASSTPTGTQKLTKINRVVWAVGDNPGAGVRDLRGKRLKTDYMVDSYNLAEERGLIVRKPGRGTTIHHYLTDEGQARYEELKGQGLIP